MGIKTISATYGQIGTFAKFENFTWMLRKRLGLDQPECTFEERQAQMALYDTLLSPASHLFEPSNHRVCDFFGASHSADSMSNFSSTSGYCLGNRVCTSGYAEKVQTR